MLHLTPWDLGTTFGAFSIYQESPEIPVGICKWNTRFWFVPLENFRNKRNFWKGSPVFPLETFRWKCVFYLQLFKGLTTSRHFTATFLNLIWRVKSQSLGGERTWVKWNTVFTQWKFPPKFLEIFCKWKTPLVYCLFSRKTWLKNKHFSDTTDANNLHYLCWYQILILG